MRRSTLCEKGLIASDSTIEIMRSIGRITKFSASDTVRQQMGEFYKLLHKRQETITLIEHDSERKENAHYEALRNA